MELRRTYHAAQRLRDHGNETVAGLAKWVMAEAYAPESRAEQYRPGRANDGPEGFTVDLNVSYEVTRNLEGRGPEAKIVAERELIDGLIATVPEKGLPLHIQVRFRT